MISCKFCVLAVRKRANSDIPTSPQWFQYLLKPFNNSRVFIEILLRVVGLI